MSLLLTFFKRMSGLKVALITGASSGIGAATAIHFAKIGYKLAICGRDEAALAKTATQCLEINPKLSSADVLQLLGDLSGEKFCEEIVQKTIERFNRLDVLVANAGILVRGSLETHLLEDFDRVMRINCRSVVVLTKFCVPHLVETKGNIVNVSSICGLRSFPGALFHCISKAGLDQMTRCTALELASKGVRVNAVNPGVIVTEIQKRSGMSEEFYAQYMEEAKASHPLGRHGTADEVAKAIAFLASDDASFITGVTLPVDGGRSVSSSR